jgi:ATP-dependent helicase/DNAse subunit B
LKQRRSNERVEDEMKAYDMDLHLYPSVLSRDHALREEARARGLLFDHRHYTHSELSERLFRSEGLPGRSIDFLAQTVFVRSSLTSTSGEEPSPGLVAEHRHLIDELKGAGLAVDDVARCLEELDPAVSAHTRRALQHFLDVFRHYQRCLADAHLLDQGDRDLAVLARLGQHLAAGTKPVLLGEVRRVIVHDIYHLSLVHYALVSLLIKLMEEGGVLQHFSGATNVDALSFAEFTWQRFVADESLAALVLPEFATPRPRGGNLEALSERLFARDAEVDPIAPDGTVRVVAAPGRAREVENLARRIRDLLRRGVFPERVAVMVRNLDQYGDLLESVCRRYRIPLWFRRGLPLFHVPLTKTVFSLLELADSTYPRAALLGLLGSVYLRPEQDWPADVVGLVNAAGYLDRRHAPLPVLLEAYIQRHQPDETETRRIRALAAWVEDLHSVLDDLIERPRPFLAYLQALKALLTRLGVLRTLGLQAEVPLHVVQRDREALQVLFDTLWTGAEALQVLGDEALEFPAFRLLAIDLLREVSLDQPLPADGAVRVLGPQDLLGLDFDHVFIPGLADTEFPRHYSAHPVLDDDARRALNPAARSVLTEKFAGILERRLLGKPLLTTLDKAREEPLLFFMALEAANASCVMSYPTRTADGEVIFPSIFVDEVRRHFPEGEGAQTVLERLPALPSVPAPALCLEPGELLRCAARTWSLPEGARAAGLTALDDALSAHGVTVERLRQLAATEGRRRGYLQRPGAASDLDPAAFGDIGRRIDLQAHLLDPERPWSPTMLEDVAACPFLFFAKHLLRLRPRTAPDYDVSPVVLGELAHRVLAEFFQVDPGVDSATAVRRMRTIAARLLCRPPDEPGFGHPGFWQVRRAELLAVFDDLAVHLATHRREVFRTHYQERELSGEACCGSWTIALQGRVDRVAVRDGPSGIDAILVQDFKYSRSAGRYRQRLDLEALGRTSFQLPIYLHLTLQQLAREGQRLAPDAVLKIEYLLLKDPTQKTWEVEVSPVFLASSQSGTLFDGLQQAIEPALAGRFAPRPREAKQTCTYCAYTALCRYWTSGAGADTP